MIIRALRQLFFLFARGFLLIVIGLNVRHREHLPESGPAIIVANHNSHLDALVLITLFPPSLLRDIRIVAAGDYFMKQKLMAWFSRHIIGVLPVWRGSASRTHHPLEECMQVLREGKILIIFPEGTRGEPEQMASLKKGIAHLAEAFPSVPVTPVFMHGLGKALPKGDPILVPFFCDVVIGQALFWQQNRNDFMELLRQNFDTLGQEIHKTSWQ